MQLGIGLPSFSSPTHAIPPDRFRRYVQAADERGFAGAWVIEHLAKPPSYATSLLDPLTTLTYTAGQTETLPVGTSVLLLPLRNPVMVAKRAATIQHLASRRVTLGLGTGYVPAEFDAVGVPMDERSARFLEGIQLLRALFTGSAVTFDGDYYPLSDFTLEPAPGQPPRLLAGGGGVDQNGTRVVRDTVLARFEHADGWIAPPRAMEPLLADLGAIETHLDTTGTDPTTIDKVALQYVHLEPGDDPDQTRRTQREVYANVVGPDRSPEYAMENWLTGTLEDIMTRLDAYATRGFDEIILHPVATDPDALDRQLTLAADYLLPHYP